MQTTTIGHNNHPVSKLIYLAFFFLITTHLAAQENHDKWFGMVNLNEGYRFNETTEWSTPGLNYELFFRLSESIGLQSKTGFLLWKNADSKSLFTMIGGHCKLLQAGQCDILVYANAGPSAIVGNDYSGFFGIVESGFKVLPTKHKSFNASISWNQNMAFHDSSITYIAVSAGYVF